jgi:hypothetical protein
VHPNINSYRKVNMMVPKRSLLVASAALLCFGTVANAQHSHTQKVRRVTKPLIQAELDLNTGQYTIGSKVNQKGAAIYNTSRSISNVDFAGFVGIDSTQCEWFDKAEKVGSVGGKSQIMTSFLFAYCSSALATQSGGVGGSATVSFVEGYMAPALGGPRPAFSSRTAVFNLSGLPANTANSSFFGGFNCFFIRVRTATQAPSPAASFDGGVALSDGVVGWGWDFRDLSLFVPLAHTFPFLACVQSCSGTGPDGQNMTDGVDQYCGAFPSTPPFTLLSSFTFGTTTTYSSVNMEVREANAIASGNAIYNPVGPYGGGSTNPSILTNVASIALGQPWKVGLDCTAAASGKPAIFIIEFKPGFVSPSVSPAGLVGNVLVAIAPPPVRKVFTVSGAGGNPVTFPPGGPGVILPIDLQFLNACYQVQGLCGDSPKGFLSNGLNQTVGSN